MTETLSQSDKLRTQQGFLSLELSLASLVLLTITFGFVELMRYVNARTALERSVAAAAKCISPTDGICNHSNSSILGDAKYEWWGSQVNRTPSYSAQLERYEAAVDFETINLNAVGYRRFNDQLHIGFQITPVSVVEVKRTFNKYLRVNSTFTPYRIDWHPLVRFPTHDENHERYCQGTDRARVQRTTAECRANYPNIAFVSAGSTSIQGSPHGRNRILSPIIQVPLLQTQINGLDYLPSAADVCLTNPTTGLECFPQWRTHGRLALLVTMQVRCRGSASCSVGAIGLDALQVEILDPQGQTLIDHPLNLGGIRPQTFGTNYSWYNFKLRGPDGANGGPVGCRTREECVNIYESIYIPRGLSFRIVVNLTQEPLPGQRPSGYDAIVDYGYVVDEYQPEVQALNDVSYPGEDLPALTERCQHEELNSRGFVGRCYFKTSNSRPTCEKPNSSNQQEFREATTKLTEDKVWIPSCDGVDPLALASEHLPTNDAVACSVSLVGKPLSFVVGKATKGQCSSPWKNEDIEYLCKEYPPQKSKTDWTRLCNPKLVASITALKQQREELNKLQPLLGGLTTKPIDVATTVKQKEADLNWSKGDYPPSHLVNLSFTGELSRPGSFSTDPPSRNDLFRALRAIDPQTGKEISAASLNNAGEAAVQTSTPRTTRKFFSQHYPFLSSRSDGFVPPIPNWTRLNLGSEKEEKNCNPYPEWVRSFPDALRYFASNELPEILLHDADGSFKIKLHYSEPLKKQVSLSLADLSAYAHASPYCPVYETEIKTSVDHQPTLIGRLPAGKQPRECEQGGKFVSCYPKLVETEELPEFDQENSIDFALAKELGQKMLGQFVPAKFSCNDQMHCAQIAIDTDTPGQVSVVANYNMPLGFPFNLFNKTRFVELHRTKHEMLELEAIR